jgi:hypothetical protein
MATCKELKEKFIDYLYSRRNYSRADESEHAIEQLEEMLKTAGGESEHMAIKKAISILKNS